MFRKKQFCTYGHDTFLVGRNRQGSCRKCKQESYRKWAKKNPEKIRAYMTKWRTTNPERSTFHARKQRYGKYGMTEETYAEMLKQQDDRCKICRRHKSQFKCELSIDHDHKTKKVRGLLCADCNTAIGLFHENVGNLHVAVDYLEGSNV